MRFLALRVVAVAALILLLWNPASTRELPAGDQPIVLLDGSLSMTGPGEPWRAALDSARALARSRGALVWRFGNRVAGFDSVPPAEGASRLAPALEAAAARGGEVIVLTDGVIDDAGSLPPDLRRRPRVIVNAHPPFFDAFIASVAGTRHVTRTDTIRLSVSYGVAGGRDPGARIRDARITVSVGGRGLLSQRVTIPDSGVLSADIAIPASRIPTPGSTALDVRLEGVADAESRDDIRQFVVEVSQEPAAVILASPPDWETRFLARTISDVARLPVKVFVETETDRWRDAATLQPVDLPDVARAAQAARLVVLTGDPDAAGRVLGSGAPRGARLLWITSGQPGDWYVERPAASPLSAALSGISWDSLPPATSAALSSPAARDTGAMVALTARLARRGSPRAIVTLDARAASRRATVTASGLWRWSFRGGAAEEAYRSLVAGLVDWLLGEQRAGSRERAVPLTLETPNGLPLSWRWTGAGDPAPLGISLEADGKARTDTLRFDAAGRAELMLPPGTYRYALAGGAERGVVAVETWSDEWRPRAPSLTAQAGAITARTASVGLRDRWWLFVIAIIALAAEWAWRRRQGLP